MAAPSTPVRGVPDCGAEWQMSTAMEWRTDGLDWPNRDASSFVDAGGLRWHVQRLGRGDPMLLIHGTGSSTHSWRDLAPLLARRFEVIAPDLPGHGFTASPDPERLSLPGMAGAVARLLSALALRPCWVVGHSAGAAVLARLCLDGAIAPQLLLSLNGALLPLSGLRHPAFAPFARLLVRNPLIPRLFAWQASHPDFFARLLEQTGSRIDARGVDLYRRLASRPEHIGAALDMMARWDVRPLERELPRLAVPLVLISGGRDRMIPPSHAESVHRLVPSARLLTLPDVGHLAHEERPEELAALIDSLCSAAAR
jgi:magnesium chelatase accessory protein